MIYNELGLCVYCMLKKVSVVLKIPLCVVYIVNILLNDCLGY